MRRVWVPITVLLAAAAMPAAANAADPEAAWIELGPVRDASVRAITEDAACPSVRIDGEVKDMNVRVPPAPPDYDVLTCEKGIDRDVSEIKVGGKELKPPVDKPRRIALVGDTGCRMAGAGFSQACNDPAAWPFERVADSIAKWDPDLIVHVGDYHYREQPCPSGNSGCAGSPYGFNWPTWDADFFSPAAKALRSAPWVLARGNHESCARAGEGWFRFLDPRPFEGCADYTTPYAVRMGGSRLVVMDTSFANDFSPFNPDQYVPQFTQVRDLVGGRESFLITHKPLWGLAATNNGAGFAVTNTTLQQASNNALPRQIQGVIAGHLHNAEVLGSEGDRQPQVVVGNGGVQMDPQITAPIVGTVAAGAKIVNALAESRFGFMTIAGHDSGRNLVLRDTAGNPFSRCKLSKSTVPCRPPGSLERR